MKFLTVAKNLEQHRLFPARAPTCKTGTRTWKTSTYGSPRRLRHRGDGKIKRHQQRFLTLLSELADEGRIADLSIAFSAYARAHPANAPYVLGQIAAKVVNRYYYLRLKLAGKAIERWQVENPDWADTFRDHINDSVSFVAVVESGAALIRRLDK